VIPNLKELTMAQRNRGDDGDILRSPSGNPQPDRMRDTASDQDWRRGYDETVRRGPPLDTEVATGDFREGRDTFSGAGVRGYGESGSGEQWGGSPGQAGHGGGDFRGMGGDYATEGPPDGFGSPGGWGRLGGWNRGGNGVQRRAGPKGYKRSDDRIREDLCEHLMDISEIDVSDVSIEVRDGHVTLEGTVPQRGMKYDIEDIAATTLGVTDVENNIRVPRQRLEE
jgi:hypothetical protein